MEGSIYGEDEVVTGVDVIDNSGVELDIQVERDGNIYSLNTEGYPDDPAERNYVEARNVEEAASYATYHVYRERGYDTLKEGENPDRLALAALVVASLPDDALLDHFGDLYHQLESHYGGDQRPMPWPEGFEEDYPAIYMKDVYLGLDPDELAAIAEPMGDGAVFDLLADVPELTKRGQTRGFEDLPAITSIAQDHGLTDADGQPRPLEEWIDAVSDLHLKWRDETDRGNRFEMGEEPDLDRDYDARLQVRPFDPEDPEGLRNGLIYNLKCQIRDRFVEYGMNPPEGVRVTGPGDDAWTVTYIQLDLYQDFHDPEAAVDWTIENWPDRAAGDQDDDGGLF